MSILLIHWASKQTKKGVSKADKSIKRRSQMRQQKRMTRLGLHEPYFASLPDSTEDDPFNNPLSSPRPSNEPLSYSPRPSRDPFISPRLSKDQSWDSRDSLPLSALRQPQSYSHRNHTLASVEAFLETHNENEASSSSAYSSAPVGEGRKSYHIELRKPSIDVDDESALFSPHSSHNSLSLRILATNSSPPSRKPSRISSRPANVSNASEDSIEELKSQQKSERKYDSLMPDPLKVKKGKALLKRVSGWRKGAGMARLES